MSHMKLVGEDGVSVPIEVRRPSYKDCKHDGGVVVDDELRTVECKTCGKHLDPIQVLIRLCQKRKLRQYEEDAVWKHKMEEWQKRVRLKAAGTRSYKTLWEASEADAAGLRCLLQSAAGRLREMGDAEYAASIEARTSTVGTFAETVAEEGAGPCPAGGRGIGTVGRAED